MMRRSPRRPLSAAAAVAAVACVLASCSPSPAPSTTSPPPPSVVATTAPATTASPAAGCAELAELKSSLEALTQVQPAEDGVPALKAAIADVKTNLEAAQGSVSEILQPSLDQVKTAFADLQSAARGVTADNVKEKAPTIRAAMAEVRTALAELSSTLTQRCAGS